ncbi:MAG: hypothetical protein P8183_11385, partial [Anaerolineae bacterium]
MKTFAKFVSLFLIQLLIIGLVSDRVASQASVPTLQIGANSSLNNGSSTKISGDLLNLYTEYQEYLAASLSAA